MSEHTPGPWIAAERDAPEQPLPCMPRISVGQPVESGGPSLEQCVAWIIPSRFGGTQHEANANLIAAAPDLLEALKAVIEYLPLKPHVNSAYNRAQVAIAKAEGSE